MSQIVSFFCLLMSYFQPISEIWKVDVNTIRVNNLNESAHVFNWKCIGVQLRVYKGLLSNEPWYTLNWTPKQFYLNSRSTLKWAWGPKNPHLKLYYFLLLNIVFVIPFITFAPSYILFLAGKWKKSEMLYISFSKYL